MTKTRFAPSPTGSLHIGGIRTALFSWLYARHNNGKFILRIEDTDLERSTDQSIQIITEGIDWLGLDYDEEIYFQTQRFDRYKQVINTLLENNVAYYCYCTKHEVDAMREEAIERGEKPKYNGTCRNRKEFSSDNKNPVIRFKNPLEGEVVFNDLVQGKVIFDNKELDDLIIARSDGTPTYNLTVVVDDMDMQITDVIRGDDHLNNTPRQINIFKSLNADIPNYAHLPMILGSDGKKLSKRDDAASILYYRDEGYLPEALLNYLIRLGWSKGDQEIFSIDEMISEFDVIDINKSSASFDSDKLRWLNQYYLKNLNSHATEKLAENFFKKMNISINDGPDLSMLIKIQKERVNTLKELVDESKFFYKEFSDYDSVSAKKHLRPVILEPLKSLYNLLDKIENWCHDEINDAITRTLTKFEIKIGKLAQPIRVAVTGKSVSPSIDDTLQLLGKEKTLYRITRGINFIENRIQS